jgi:hypothetical protein
MTIETIKANINLLCLDLQSFITRLQLIESGLVEPLGSDANKQELINLKYNLKQVTTKIQALLDIHI